MVASLLERVVLLAVANINPTIGSPCTFVLRVVDRMLHRHYVQQRSVPKAQKQLSNNTL